MSPRSSHKQPLTMQLSSPGLSHVIRNGFTVTTLIQSNKPPNGKVQPNQDQNEDTDQGEVKIMSIIFFAIKGSSYKEFVPGPNSQFHLLFCPSCMNLGEKVAPNSVTKELVMISQQCTISLFTRFFERNNITVALNLPTRLTWPSEFSLF